MIEPTVGRVVLFYDNNGPEPHAAIITEVHGECCVNLCAFSKNGIPKGYTSVPLLQDDDPRPSCCFCEWMPYQKGQAAKTEALEEQIKEEG